jgi:hypothetical protein
MRFGLLLTGIEKIPDIIDHQVDGPVSGEDYDLVAAKLDEAARKLRVLGDCRRAELAHIAVPRRCSSFQGRTHRG